ncbi:type I-C CRISPR-associated endonuclease Cas1 [Lysinibacillus agricola]|uniref:CRISPR-associated endonuclease Cas1 n=1 Tax=Lysinibacillus agricola TaxID=2590012 RepID=A0ABX7AXB3_9BACI|nr:MULTISPECIES: type I-C CRISPR-associated endonuclease Cas1c [Lysinibacillus]KOS60310.1 CRISPR-associated protein Cas1 [Lysinibacillus sp. FJAT-14222]QQP14603.1 type I-C CRISPR-associated endonuclease Cas1 [Lysinibacillus agricola]
MKKLLNTLFITTPDIYLSLKGENVVITHENQQLGRFPLHNFEAICTFGYAGASPKLMYACAEKNINLTFLSRSGRFLARVVGESKGNVILRKTQYRLSENEVESAKIARNFIFAKIANQKWILERMARDYPLRIDVPMFKQVSSELTTAMKAILVTEDLERLRGLEGQAATAYFKLFDQMILQQKDIFYFRNRNRRPPTDNVNALLSLAYTLLASDVTSALETVGLDAYVGYLHRDRPGRASLALDVMEELRGVMADRFVLKMINKKMMQSTDFVQKENGAVLLTDDGRRKFIKAWQERKQESLTHPYLNEKINWGLVPHAQAILLARYLRGDIEEYPPFLWK